MSPDPVARSTIRVRVCGLIQSRMKFKTRRWLPNHRLSCRSRSRSRSNSAETGCGRSIISNTAGSKLRFIQEKIESGKQESRKGISEIEGKAARVATEFQSRKRKDQFLFSYCPD